MMRLALFVLLIGLLAGPTAAAETARGVVAGREAPAGLTVLDRRGDLWLVSGDEAALRRAGATLLAAPPARDPQAAPARTFIPAPTPVIDDLVAQVDGAELIAAVEWLVGLGVRYSQSPNLLAVADSLEAKLASYGLDTEKHWFPMGSLSVPNVIATKTGKAYPDSVFVICAHYDATSENARFFTPGADDNGSGTVAVLTAARLLSTVATDCTVKFVLFAGEEQGLVGSEAWTADMAAAGAPIAGALNFDMIAWWTSGVPFDLEIETNQASRWLADAITWAADTYTTMTYELHVNDDAWWGDHYPFWVAGYDAVNHEESYDWYDPDFNPYYHSTADTPEKLSQPFFTGSVQVGVAALAALAGARNVSAAPDAPAPGAAALTAGPNPFNGRVVLKLAVPDADGPQAVALYDLRGRRVAAVAVTVRDGRGEAVWDARDAAGRAVPAGVYLARAEDAPGRPGCRVAYVP